MYVDAALLQHRLSLSFEDALYINFKEGNFSYHLFLNDLVSPDHDQRP